MPAEILTWDLALQRRTGAPGRPGGWRGRREDVAGRHQSLDPQPSSLPPALNRHPSSRSSAPPGFWASGFCLHGLVS